MSGDNADIIRRMNELHNDLKEIKKELQGIRKDQIDSNFELSSIKKDLQDLKTNQTKSEETLFSLDKKSVTWDYSSKGFFAMLGLVVTSFFVAVINFFLK